MVETIFTNPLFVETILPFLLVFTLVFAILEKTKILGDGKRQIDAIVALVVGLLFVAFGQATDVVVKMIPVLGVAVVVIFVFLLLLGSAFGPEKFEVKGWLRVVIGILAAILVIGLVLVFTGVLDPIIGFLYSGSGGSILINTVLILVVIGAVVAVVWGGKGSSGGSS